MKALGLAAAAAAVVLVFFMSSSVAFLLYGYQGHFHVFTPAAPASFSPGASTTWATFTQLQPSQVPSGYTGGFKLKAYLYNSTSTYTDIGTLNVISDQLAISVASVTGSLLSSSSYIHSVIIEITPAGSPPNPSLPPGPYYYGCTIEINETSNGPLPYYYEYTYTVGSGGAMTPASGPTSVQQCWLTGTGKAPGMSYYVTVTLVGNPSQMVTPNEDLGMLTVNFNFNAAWNPSSPNPSATSAPSAPPPPAGGPGG